MKSRDSSEQEASAPKMERKSQHLVSCVDLLVLINNPINPPQIYYGHFARWGSKILLINPIQ